MASTKTGNGILAVPASLTNKKVNSSTSSAIGVGPSVSQNSAIPRLRLIVRRLPPGLTQVEFEETLGEEWRMGAGQVDWFAYKDGKISKE
jgi:regulator of nonsense transcripts 3